MMTYDQVTGQPSVLYYAAQIFADAGFAAGGESTRISVLLGAFKLLATGVPFYTVSLKVPDCFARYSNLDCICELRGASSCVHMYCEKLTPSPEP